MILDVITAVFLLSGFVYGFSKGLIHSVLSLVSIVVGIALALKGSYVVSAYLQGVFQIPPAILPVLSFILVIIITLLIFRITAYLLQTILKALALNFINKFAGALLWSIIMILLASTVMWFIDRNGFLTESAKMESYSYRYLLPLTPIMLDYLGNVVPFFQSLFERLDTLFQDNDVTTV